MTTGIFENHPTAELPNWLFNESAGVHVVGIPGSGKSNFLLYLTQLIASAEAYPVFLIDPAGDTARAARDFCWNLSPSARKRLHYIRPSDEATTVCLNPLKVQRPSHLSARVSYCNHILLTAWGATDFNSTPRLAKWTTLAVKALALLGLPLCYTLDMIDPESPVHTLLIEAIADKSPFIHRELRKIARYSLSEWDDQLGSTHTRWMGFLDNPVVQAILCRNDGLDMRTLQEERAIVLIDLDKGGVLRDEDQEIIANLYLSELLYAVYNTPNPIDRIPTFLLLDELPMFRSSFNQLTDALKQVRKYLLRLVCCHQGVYSLPDGPESPLLNMLMSCKTQIFFQLINTADTLFFGKQLAQSEYKPDAVKHILTQTQFYTAGHDIINLIQEGQSYAQTIEQGKGGGETTEESQNWNAGYGLSEASVVAHADGRSQEDSLSNTDSKSKTQGANEVNTATETRNPEAIRQMISQANAKASGTTQSEQAGTAKAATHATGRQSTDTRSREQGRSQQQGVGGGSGSGRSNTWTASHAHQVGQTFTYRQTLFPIIKSREIISSIQFLSPEEHTLLKAQALAQLDIGTCYMYLAGKVIVRVPFPEMINPYKNAPLTGERERQNCLAFIRQRPHYQDSLTLTDQRERFHEYLLELLRKSNPSPALDPPIIDVATDGYFPTNF